MTGIQFLAAATEYLCGMLVTGAFFTRRQRGRWLLQSTVFLCGLVHICLSVFTNGWPLAPRAILILGNWFLVCEICYCGNIWKRILVLLLFGAVVFAIDISVLVVCMAVMKQSAQEAVSPSVSYLISMLTARTLLLSVSFGCRGIVRRQKRKQEGRGLLWICLLLIPLYTMVGTGALISSAMEGGGLSGSVVVLGGGLLCINILLCLVVNRLEQNRLAEEERQKLQIEAAHNLELAKVYQDSFQQQRKITHEFRNQVDVVGNLLAQKEYGRAMDYVRYLQNTAQELVPSIRTNHPMVDAILNQKYQQAAQKGVSMLLSCNDLSGIPLEDSDLVTLLGNLLDNAISASAQTEEKQIWMRLWQEQSIYQMVVRNSCLMLPIGYEAKKCLLHGFGTGLVEAVLEKYGYPHYAEQIGTIYIFTAILG